MINWLKNLFSPKQSEPEIEQDPKKYLIAGLGNIGGEYENTRHNIGFDIIDYLVEEHNLTFDSRGYAFYAKLKIEDYTFILIKPTTYMNVSGKAVSYWMEREKIGVENLLVIIDDLNINFGRLRMRGKGSDGGHNGLKHINATLGTKEYTRLRFGIGNEFGKGQQINYVIGEWSVEEQKTLSALVRKSAEMVKGFGTLGLSGTMSKYNN
ncbi:MAG: PTH1 family peptidyl-tRNA hydrolase [Polaribacter sp.]|jgi:PTH1 family peptidyl-tRNA hydrolase